MEFRMLGPFEAWHNGIQLDLGDLQQRYVLIVLLRHANRPVPTGRLVDIVWSGQEAPRTNLIAGYVARLRKTFRTADADHLDTERFARLCAAADDECRAGRPNRAMGLLHAAMDLWRGEFLEDIDIDRVG